MRMPIGVALVLAPALAVAAPAPLTSVAALDPARLAGGRALAMRMVPPGAYQKVMQGSMSSMTDGIMKQALDLPVRQFAAMAGLSPEDLAKLQATTLRQIMAIVDPAYEQRMQVTTRTIFAVMGEVLDRFEPDMREGVAEAYAARFTAAQLAELNAFFATPTGASFAGQQMTLMSDPAIVSRMQTLLPAIFKQLPEVGKRVQAATANLPKPKTAADLSDADRHRLAALLGVDPVKLKGKGS